MKSVLLNCIVIAASSSKSLFPHVTKSSNYIWCYFIRNLDNIGRRLCANIFEYIMTSALTKFRKIEVTRSRFCQCSNERTWRTLLQRASGKLGRLPSTYTYCGLLGLLKGHRGGRFDVFLGSAV